MAAASSNLATQLLDRHVTTGRGKQPAVLFADSDESISYAELQEQVNRFGNSLLKLGAAPADRVLLVAYDCPNTIVALLGTIKIGCVAVIASTQLSAEDFRYIVSDSTPTFLVISAKLGSSLLGNGRPVVSKNLIVLGDSIDQLKIEASWTKEMMLFSSLINTAVSNTLEAYNVTPNTPAYWQYSSGTTGQPKAVVHAHKDPLASSSSYGQHVLGITAADRCLSTSRLFFAYGFGGSVFLPFAVGASTVVYSSPVSTPDLVFRLIATYKPTVFFTVPSMYARLLAHQAATAPDLSSVRLCVSAGEALPAPVFESWKKRYALDILDGIGATETTHIFISNRVGAIRPGSSGLIVPGYEAKILDEEGKLVQRGEVGMLYVSGSSLFSLYWNKKEKTREALTEDGWYRTGDSYSQDEQGYFYHHGRSDDLFKHLGMWVSPVVVESELLKHPGVLEAAVVGRADETDQLTRPVAYVVQKTSFKEPAQLLLQELHAQAAEALAPHLRPHQIVVVSELPKTATGKIQRFKLRSLDSATLPPTTAALLAADSPKPARASTASAVPALPSPALTESAGIPSGVRPPGVPPLATGGNSPLTRSNSLQGPIVPKLVPSVPAPTPLSSTTAAASVSKPAASVAAVPSSPSKKGLNLSVAAMATLPRSPSALSMSSTVASQSGASACRTEDVVLRALESLVGFPIRDQHRSLQEYGVESGAMQRFANAVQSGLGLAALPAVVLNSISTIAEIVAACEQALTKRGSDSKYATAAIPVAMPHTNGTHSASPAANGVAHSTRTAADGELVIPLVSENIHTLFRAQTKQSPKPLTKETVVLLTGATGYLGSYMLRELLAEANDPASRLRRVYCLVREKQGRDDVLATLKEMWKTHRWSNEEHLDTRMLLVHGSLTQLQLGLSDSAFANLTAEVTHVLHCAWHVDLSSSWRGGPTATGNANLLGVQNLLHLCATGKRKSFHFVSSIMSAVRAPTPVPELPSSNPGEAFPSAYGLSKWVAEKWLVDMANFYALPIAIYRVTTISGDSQSGYWQSGDYLPRVIRACCEMQAIPGSLFDVNCLPVDFVAKAIVVLALNETQKIAVRNIVNPETRPWKFASNSVKNLLPHLQIVPRSEWLQMAEQRSNTAVAPLLTLVRSLAAQPFPKWETAITQRDLLALRPLVFPSLSAAGFARSWARLVADFPPPLLGPISAKELAGESPIYGRRDANKVAAEWPANALQLLLGVGRSAVVQLPARVSVADLVAIEERKATVKLADSARDAVDASQQLLYGMVTAGKDIYGVTTGFGGSAEQRVQAEQATKLQNELVRFLSAGFGECAPETHVRGMMTVRLLSLVQGASAIRWQHLDTLGRMLNENIVPWVPMRGTISASGDLVPLGYLARAIIGASGSRSVYRGAIMESAEAHSRAGITPVPYLLPKEGLAIVNGTAYASSIAAKVILDCHGAMLLCVSTTAMAFEALRASNQSLSPFIHKMKPHRGQQLVAATLRHVLDGSKLIIDELEHESDKQSLKQDRYSTRTAPQWLGPLLEQLELALEQVTTELNSVTDNPLVDVHASTGSHVLHGGNFQGQAITTAMDSARAALASMGKLVFAQFSELINKDSNKGLPANLACDNPSLDYGMKGIEITMASYMTELSYLATPVAAHVVSAELNNQNVNSCGAISARHTEKAVEILQMMLSCLLLATCTACDLRVLSSEMLFFVEQNVLEALCEARIPGGSHAAEKLLNRMATTPTRRALERNAEKLVQAEAPGFQSPRNGGLSPLTVAVLSKNKEHRRQVLLRSSSPFTRVMVDQKESSPSSLPSPSPSPLGSMMRNRAMSMSDPDFVRTVREAAEAARNKKEEPDSPKASGTIPSNLSAGAIPLQLSSELELEDDLPATDESTAQLFANLRNAVRNLNVFSYVFDPSRTYSPLLDAVTISIWNHMSNPASTYYMKPADRGAFVESFRGSLHRRLAETVPEMLAQDSKTLTSAYLGNTKPLYEYVRNRLQVPLPRAGKKRTPDLDLMPIFEAIRSRSIFTALHDVLSQ